MPVYAGLQKQISDRRQLPTGLSPLIQPPPENSGGGLLLVGTPHFKSNPCRKLLDCRWLRNWPMGSFSLHARPPGVPASFAPPPKIFFKKMGPWTADVQGPLLNSCVMNVVLTTLAAHPVKNPGAARRAYLASPSARPLGQSSSFPNIFPALPAATVPFQNAQATANE